MTFLSISAPCRSCHSQNVRYNFIEFHLILIKSSVFFPRSTLFLLDLLLSFFLVGKITLMSFYRVGVCNGKRGGKIIVFTFAENGFFFGEFNLWKSFLIDWIDILLFRQTLLVIHWKWENNTHRTLMRCVCVFVNYLTGLVR